MSGEIVRSARTEGVLHIDARTLTVNPPSINGGATGTVDVSCVGVPLAALVFVTPPATLENGLVFAGAHMVANGSVRVAIRNVTGAPIDGAPINWRFLFVQEIQ